MARLLSVNVGLPHFNDLAGLLKPFHIISETVSIPGLADAKGYKRERFEEA
jgi:hypothetical protein